MAVPITTLILSILSLLLLPSPSFANEENVILTGDVLPNTGRIAYGGSTFIMQDDCNLVLYQTVGGGFQSNTARRGTGCTLTLNDYGRLIIRDDRGRQVWQSRRGGSRRGQYAAVIGPDGHVNVYGPSIWSTLLTGSTSASGVQAELMNSLALRRNLLFSSQVLFGDSTLASRSYTLELTQDCNLQLRRASTSAVLWQSNTRGNGRHCFVRLNHRGQLSVIADTNNVLWSSTPAASTEGNYVLIVQINGQAVVYGPVVWSTANPNILMPTAEK